MGRIAAHFFILMALTGGGVQAQLVTLNVVATDKQGHAIVNLKAADLQIFDEGTPQRIVMFRKNNGAFPVSVMPSGPQEYSNRKPGVPSGTTLILFDLLNGTFTDREYIVSSLVKTLKTVEYPGNLYLYLLTNKGDLFPVRALPGDPSDSPPQDDWTRRAKASLDAAIQKVYGFRPLDNLFIDVRITSTVKAFAELSSGLAGLSGRKNIVWITNGFPVKAIGGLCRDIVILNTTAPCAGNYVNFEPVVRRLATQLDGAGISLYPVDEWSVEGGERLLVNQTLETLADMTAGHNYLSGGLHNAIPDALNGMRFNYSLAYRPEPNSWDGKYHKIQVTSARKGIQIQYERSYLAEPRMDGTTELMQAGAASNSDLQAIGLVASESPGPDSNTVSIKLWIDASDLAITQQDGHYTGQIAVLYTSVATDGAKQLRKPKNIALTWMDQQYEQLSKNGVSLNEILSLSAGIHRLRIVVVDTKSNQVGSLTIPLSGETRK